MSDNVTDSLRPWANLPLDIVSDIANRLDSFEFLVFRSICSSWRREIIPGRSLISPNLPVHASLPTHCSCTRLRGALLDGFTLSGGAIYLLRAPADSSPSQSPGFFLLVAEEFVKGTLRLRNPLSRSSVAQLPFSMPESLNLLDFDAVEVARSYSVSTGPYNSVPNLTNYRLLDDVIKAILLPDVAGAAALLLHNGLLRVVAFGNGDSQVLHYGLDFKFDDMVEFGGRIIGVNRRGKVYWIDGDGVTPFGYQIKGNGRRRKRLVVSPEALHLVVRCSDPDEMGEEEFKVYKLVVDRWVQSRSIGDMVFFVGLDFSFSISSQQGVAGSRVENYILATEDSFPCYHKMDDTYLRIRLTGNDDLQLGVIRLNTDESTDKIQYHPCFTRVLWPPPVWLHPNAKLNPIEALRNGTRRLTSRIKHEESYLMFAMTSNLPGVLFVNEYMAAYNSFLTGYYAKQFADYAQFFEALGGSVEAKINLAKQSSPDCSSNPQVEMGGTEQRVEERHDTSMSNETARMQSEVLKEVYDLFYQTATPFNMISHQIRNNVEE